MLELVERLLTDNPMLLEQVISALAVIAGVVWARVKRSEWHERAADSEYGRALAVVDAAVEEVGRTYVRELKAKSKDGKLTRAEIAEVNRVARQKAAAMAGRVGVDLAGTIGNDFIDLKISESVKRQKSGTTLLPAATLSR